SFYFDNSNSNQWVRITVYQKQPGFSPDPGSSELYPKYPGLDGSLTQYVQLGRDDKTHTFHFLKSGLIEGRVFNDWTNTTTRQLADPGVPGVTVYLDTNNNGQLDPGEVNTRTAADGTYFFLHDFNTDATAVSAHVRQILPAGWKVISAPTGTVTINSDNPW